MFRRHVFAALLAAAAAGSLQSAAEAATIVGGSDLLDGAGAAQIETWLGHGPTTFTNIYDKTAGDTSGAFHSAADGKGPTVFLAQISGGFGTAIIGGYNPQSWNAGINDWTHTTGATPHDAFLFNLTDATFFPQVQNDTNGQYQAYNAGNVGPAFGGGFDVVIEAGMDNGHVNPFSYCAVGVMSCSGAANLLPAGYSDFTIGALETFSVSASVATTPIPAALPLFASALGCLGFAGWRRRKATAA